MKRTYYINGVFGLTGSGKTTYLARCGALWVKHHSGVIYSNFPLKGAIRLDVENLGKFEPIPDSIMLIDEISLVCDCRQWKNFDSDLTYFFTHHRKHKCSIVWASQGFADADKKIRTLTDTLYHCYPWFGGFCAAYKVHKYCQLVRGSYDEGYSETRFPVLYRPKKWGKYFDTGYKKQLPVIPPVAW